MVRTEWSSRCRGITLCFSLALALSCSKKPAEKATPAASSGPRRVTLSAAAAAAAGIQIEAAAMRPIDEVLTLSGSLSYDENKVARVGPRIGGRVARILVDFGQTIRAGQALAEIDSPELAQALADWRKARSVLNVRQRDYDRAKQLLEGRAISQGEFLSREGEFNVAKSELENADSKLHLFGLSHEEAQRLTAGGEVTSAFPLRSPVAGVVIDRQINPGAVVEAGKSLFVVGDITDLWLLAQLYEKDLARVRAGQTLEVATDAFPNETFSGRIDYVGDQVDPATRTVKARAFITNPQKKLKPGMFVEARLLVSSSQPVLAVPAAAVKDVDRVPTVFIAVADNVFEPRAVEKGKEGRTFIEIKKGLRAGERVVSRGALTIEAEARKSELGGD